MRSLLEKGRVLGPEKGEFLDESEAHYTKEMLTFLLTLRSIPAECQDTYFTPALLLPTPEAKGLNI